MKFQNIFRTRDSGEGQYLRNKYTHSNFINFLIGSDAMKTDKQEEVENTPNDSEPEVVEETDRVEDDSSFDNNYNVDYEQGEDEDYGDFEEEEDDFWGSEEYK